MKRKKESYKYRRSGVNNDYYNNLLKAKILAGTATENEKAFVKRGFKSWHQVDRKRINA